MSPIIVKENFFFFLIGLRRKEKEASVWTLCPRADYSYTFICDLQREKAWILFHESSQLAAIVAYSMKQTLESLSHLEEHSQCLLGMNRSPSMVGRAWAVYGDQSRPAATPKC